MNRGEAIRYTGGRAWRDPRHRAARHSEEADNFAASPPPSKGRAFGRGNLNLNLSLSLNLSLGIRRGGRVNR